MNSFWWTASFFNLGSLAKNLRQLQKIKAVASELFSDMVARNCLTVWNLSLKLARYFCIICLNWKKCTYFLDFGATNGDDLSNTYLLKKDFGWRGIVVEPAKFWHKDLRANRTVSIDFNCVMSKFGELINFTAAPKVDYTTIFSFIQKDAHASARSKGETYSVQTISLSALLSRHRAHSKIDYLSIATEDIELEILRAFDFDQYAISVIRCEYNFSFQRSGIYEQLLSQGFVRVFEDFSHWDDWYIHSNNVFANNTNS